MLRFGHSLFPITRRKQTKNINQLRIIYSVILYLLAPFVFLRLAWRGIKNHGYLERWHERFGYINLPPDTHPRIWIHAVSVGEVQAAAPLVRRLKADYPRYRLLVTTVTPTGSAVAKQQYGAAVEHGYLPYDLPGAVKRFLSRTRPKVLIVMETEIWPNLYHLSAQRGIPVILANARLSDKSHAGYKTFSRLTAHALSKVTYIAAQTAADAGRFADLGADQRRIRVTGNLKFDVDNPQAVLSAGLAIRNSLGAERPVWIAASTHEGEEAMLLAAQRTISDMIPGSLMILAPRHPERCDGVLELCRRLGHTVMRKTQFTSAGTSALPKEIPIFLLDTLGELPSYYAAADVAFVGGSLLPGIGGHNILEPAALGVPVIHGQYMDNFRELCRLSREQKAAIQVLDGTQLAEQVILLLGDSGLRKRMGTAGMEMIKQKQGNVDSVMELVATLLNA
jgi:3-deoxy-D-manno-octulosonic-acid transferase